MSADQTAFFNAILNRMGYSSKRDIIDRLLLGSLVNSCARVDKNIGQENEIRDRVILDLLQTDTDIRKWLQNKWIDLLWENWVYTPDFELARTDIAFKMTGLHFVIECKRLKHADKAYIAEGLNRFIELRYAVGDEYAGMIGFVVSGDKTSICTNLRRTIEGLNHTTNASEVSDIPSFTSQHIRTDRTEIEIHHLFFDFQLEQDA